MGGPGGASRPAPSPERALELVIAASYRGVLADAAGAPSEGPLVCVIRESPELFHRELGTTRAEVRWLTFLPRDDGLNPADLGRCAEYLASRFDSGSRRFFLEGVDYLVKVNGIAPVVELLRALRSDAQVHGARIWLFLRPDRLSPEETMRFIAEFTGPEPPRPAAGSSSPLPSSRLDPPVGSTVDPALPRTGPSVPGRLPASLSDPLRRPVEGDGLVVARAAPPPPAPPPVLSAPGPTAPPAPGRPALGSSSVPGGPPPNGRSVARTGASSGPAKGRGWRGWAPVRIWKRYFPPVRLVWIFLAVLVYNSGGFASRAVAWPLLAVPLLCAAVDLGLQFARYPRLRIPDAAIANGMFLSLILWPTQLTLEVAAIAVITVGLRHLLRRGGHPIFNPAALGLTIAVVVFAMPEPWQLGATTTDALLVTFFGLVLWSRARHTWRLWAVYFAANALATFVVADTMAGGAAVKPALLAAFLGGAPLFYGWFMVTEPRTAPTSRPAMLAFAAVVGVVAVAFPVLFEEYPVLSAFGILSPYLALFVGNALTVALPSARGTRKAAAAPARPVAPGEASESPAVRRAPTVVAAPRARTPGLAGVPPLHAPSPVRALPAPGDAGLGPGVGPPSR